MVLFVIELSCGDSDLKNQGWLKLDLMTDLDIA